MGPLVRLVDGRGLSEAQLRARARAVSARWGHPYASRSYAPPFALVAAHTARVGVDIDRDEQWSPAQAASVLTPAETARLTPALSAASVWSGKEALAKALGDALAYDPRRLDAPAWWPAGRAGRWRGRPVEDLPAGFVGWLCWEDTG